MKLLMQALGFLFSGLELLTAVLVSPLSLICGLGLLLFTLAIAWRVRAQVRGRGENAFPAADWMRA